MACFPKLGMDVLGPLARIFSRVPDRLRIRPVALARPPWQIGPDHQPVRDSACCPPIAIELGSAVLVRAFDPRRSSEIH